ncbi:helix-turn-helix domain-containing protein [Candidatus Peregrinibacteria bacterium]|nr:helix-turn-helix domain-containing protein [Candidatus Peregrinibacteria bacterium]
MELITINDAATFSGKSIQTIRRMIKQKKIRVKRQKTPQGFNYLIIKDSLSEFIDAHTQPPTQPDVTTQPDSREHRAIDPSSGGDFQAEMERFNTTIQKLIEQNQRDKDNFFQLIKTFQDRVFTLENQIKLLEAPARRWWKFWK